jgi:hypothetical protein
MIYAAGGWQLDWGEAAAVATNLATDPVARVRFRVLLLAQPVRDLGGAPVTELHRPVLFRRPALPLGPVALPPIKPRLLVLDASIGTVAGHADSLSDQPRVLVQSGADRLVHLGPLAIGRGVPEPLGLPPPFVPIRRGQEALQARVWRPLPGERGPLNPLLVPGQLGAELPEFTLFPPPSVRSASQSRPIREPPTVAVSTRRPKAIYRSPGPASTT